MSDLDDLENLAGPQKLFSMRARSKKAASAGRSYFAAGQDRSQTKMSRFKRAIRAYETIKRKRGGK